MLNRLVFLAVALLLVGRAAAAPIGTTFTYQGQLRDQGAAASGPYDLQFRLFDSSQGGTQIGATANVNDLAVNAGLFTAQLDFGATAFNGEARYLEIAVRLGSSTGAYTTLAPRQPVTAAPYALQALNSLNVPWSGITNLPAGFADQVDNDTTYTAGNGLMLSGNQFSINANIVQARVQGSCPAGSSIRSIDATGAVQCEVAAYQSKLVRTVVVSPVGNATANGTALLAALSGITDSSCTNPYLLKLEPGVYDLGSNHLVLKDCIDVEGSGEQTTTIQASGGANANTGTVVGANNAEMRLVTVRSSGGTAAVAIHSNGATLRLTHVTALASQASGQNFAIVYRNVSIAEISNVTADAQGGADARGVYNQATPLIMTNVRAVAENATTTIGVYNENSNALMNNVDAIATAGTETRGVLNTTNSLASINGGSVLAAGATHNYGIYNTAGGSALVTHVNISVFGGNDCYGVYNGGSSSGSMSDVRISSLLAALTYGIYNTAISGSFVVDVDHSVISAATNTVRNDAEFVTRIGATKLDGGPVTGDGTILCAGVYDEAYAFSQGPACP